MFYNSVILHGVTHQKTSSLTRGTRFGTAFLVHMLNDDDDDDDDDDNNNNNNNNNITHFLQYQVALLIRPF